MSNNNKDDKEDRLREFADRLALSQVLIGFRLQNCFYTYCQFSFTLQLFYLDHVLGVADAIDAVTLNLDSLWNILLNSYYGCIVFCHCSF